MVLNAHSAGPSHTASMGNGMLVGFAPGTQLVDVLGDGSRTFTVGPDGKVIVDLAPWESVILVQQGMQLPLPM